MDEAGMKVYELKEKVVKLNFNYIKRIFTQLVRQFRTINILNFDENSDKMLEESDLHARQTISSSKTLNSDLCL